MTETGGVGRELGALASFCPGERGVVLVPVEALERDGIAVAFRRELEEGGVAPWLLAAIEASFSAYRQRSAELWRRAPRTSLPPRRLHLVVALDGAEVRPHLEPLHRSSWLLEAADLAHGPELGAWLLGQAERVSVTRDPALSAVLGLPWLLLASDAERAAIAVAARARGGAMAAALHALADACEWAGRLHHEVLAPAPLGLRGRRIDAAGLIVPDDLVASVDALSGAFATATRDATERHLARHPASPAAADRLVEWLCDARPDVLLVDGDRVLWGPEHAAEVGAARAALASVGDAPARSIQADLEVVDARSRRFLAALRDPAALPPPGESLEASGGVWVHATRRIAYALAQPGIDVLREVSPPFRRAMVAARTAHEWGHLAVEAGLVPLAPARREGLVAACRRLEETMARVVRDAPPSLHALAERDVAELAARGKTFADVPMMRIDDWRANLVMRHFLERAELEVYVRSNVRALTREPGGPFVKLVRQAYEAQYLRLAAVADPLDYLFGSAWVREQFVDGGVVGVAGLEELLATVAAICDAYEVDPAGFVEGSLSGSR